MTQDLRNKYFVRRKETDEWEDVTTKFVGVKILSCGGFNEIGDAVNVYNEQFVNSQADDFLVTNHDEQGNDVIIRKNVELQLTFICGTRYGAIDTQSAHDAFIEYVAKKGDFYIKSKYTGKEAHVVSLKSYKPTTQKLQRGINDSYIMGTIELHTLDIPIASQEQYMGDLYIGFGSAMISDPTSLSNVQHYNVSSAAGTYTVACPSLLYLWICFSGTIGNVVSDGFKIPMEEYVAAGNLRCYRSTNNIKPHTMNFSITE